MKKLFVILAAIFLTACTSNPVVVPGAFEGVQETVNIDKRLLEDCPEVTDIVDNPRPSDVLIQHGEDLKVIKCLRENNKGLVIVVKKAFNVE